VLVSLCTDVHPTRQLYYMHCRTGSCFSWGVFFCFAVCLARALKTTVIVQEEGCQPNVVTYNTLIDVCGKMGRWEDAVQVLDDMTDKVPLRIACTIG